MTIELFSGRLGLKLLILAVTTVTMVCLVEMVDHFEAASRYSRRLFVGIGDPCVTAMNVPGYIVADRHGNHCVAGQ